MKNNATGSETDWGCRAEHLLQEKFGFSHFRPGQKQVILDVLNGRDVFAMMPTGGGKSLCYQVPGYLLEGLVLIVSPLVSLMEDQIIALRRMGEGRARALNSMTAVRERAHILHHLRTLRFLYISPEMLCRSSVLEALAQTRLSLFVVDEAHCVSQWGHEFRPDYLRLAAIRQSLGCPPCLAVTATADRRVRADIIRLLDLHDAAETIMSVDRANIALVVKQLKSDTEKLQEVYSLIRKVRLPGVIYCASREWTERLSEGISQETGYRVAFYHGGMDAEDRRKIQNQFLNHELDLLCCTSAFGMGINIPDIRLVIHFHYPASMNAYLQEIGRASRDGRQGLAVLYYTDADHRYPERFIDANFPDTGLLHTVFSELDQGTLAAEDKDSFIHELQRRGASETAARFVFERIRERHPNQSWPSLFQHCLTIISERRAILLHDLSVMDNYLQQQSCRRAYYLQIYHEQSDVRPALCCDRCGIHLEDFAKEKAAPEKAVPVSGWKERLRLIFKQSSAT